MNTIILDKTEQGTFVPVSVLSKLSSNRKLFLYGDLDTNKAADICATMMVLSVQSVPDNTITLFVSTSAAQLKAILMLVDCMENLPCPVKVVCIGAVEGIATILLAAADESKMTVNSRLAFGPLKLFPSIHQTPTADSFIKRVSEYDKRIFSIMAKKMQLSIKDVKKVFEKPVFWSAKDALKHGLIDGIVSSKEEGVV